jgi:antitoxin FitA
MATITIRNLEKAVARKLRARAAQHGRSMEEEAHQILRSALEGQTVARTNLFDQIRRYVAPLGGVDLKIPRRRSMRDPPTFNDA